MMNEQNSRARGRVRYLSENEAETTLCPNVFESMNKWILEHNKRSRLYKDSMGPVSITSLVNWKLMFHASLKLQSRSIPISEDLVKKYHHSLLLHSCWYVHLIHMEIPPSREICSPEVSDFKGEKHGQNSLRNERTHIQWREQKEKTSIWSPQWRPSIPLAQRRMFWKESNEIKS